MTTVRLRGLTKRFPAVLAVDDVDLDIHSGEVLALLGQNGAGKSTLIQVLAGVYPADAGELSLDDRPYRPASPAAAEKAGIVLIPQQVAVVPDLTVGQNMYLGSEPTNRLGLVDWPRLYANAQRVLDDFNVTIAAGARMGSLDIASQQLVVLARALSANARVLILDEPTAALTESEAERLFNHLRHLRDRDVAILFVTHRLAEVFAFADRIVVMRDGRVRGDHRTHDTDRDQIVRQMLGAELTAPAGSGTATAPGPVALELDGLTVHDEEDAARLRVDRLSLTVRQGEVVGLFGLVGAGCAPAAMAVFGAWAGRVGGRVLVDGEVRTARSPAHAIAAGVGLLAPDRRQTMIAEASIAENLMLASLAQLGRAGTLDPVTRDRLAGQYVRRLGVRTPSVLAEVGTLSGGNQQKVQVGRWLSAGTRILVLVDPTHGVDVGARAEIHAVLHQLAGDGYAQLLVSADAEELVAVCDRVVVMRAGRRVAELAGAALSEAHLLHHAAGV
jgi:ABC-type sugar transport system ATPase subunit